MATRVVIVRHGQSDYNARQLIQGRCDESVLTERGTADAIKVAAALENLSFAALYHSPLQRAAQTAATIRDRFTTPPPAIASDQLLEIDLPLWEKLSKSAVREQFAEQYQQWQQQPDEFFMTVGDRPHYPVRALYAQAQAFWQEVLPKHPDATLLVVAHNGINRCLLMTALGMAPARYQTLQQSNCCINILNFQGGWGEPVQLESLNQVAHLGIPLPPPRPPGTPVRLLLVRHGETEWNRVSRFQGAIDVPLNDAGRAQARKAADYLRDVPLNFAASSPLLRPKETAEIILAPHPDLKLRLDARFCEISHGSWEGKFEREIATEYPELLQRWKSSPDTVQMPDGENLRQVWERAIAAWQDLVQAAFAASTPASPTVGLLVAHDAINKVILCHLLGLAPKDFWAMKQGNGAVSVIDYPYGPDRLPILQAINLTSHLGAGVLDRTAAGAL
ncbi:MAG: histidine phosphatase family protein [Spirulinaceae cyanobacterium SM2_1_0]|nr:histidine phosphatase family protein [Spirulinaceae cyanobacterium SM2_1_0]